MAPSLVRMKFVCPLCEREGRPGDPGEVELYDNSATMRGICSRHREQAREARPSPSFPDAEMLIVVRPNDTDLYEYLVQRFAEVSGVQVILERRRADRPIGGRVREERRTRQGTVSALGYMVVRFKRMPPPASAGTGAGGAVMNQESLGRLIRQKIQDGRLPRGRLPSAITGRPGDGSRCAACDEIITQSMVMILVPLTERPSSRAEEAVPLHGECFQIWSRVED
jgi:hypothetical protein